MVSHIRPVLAIDFGTSQSSGVVIRGDGTVLRVKDPVSGKWSIPSSVCQAKSGELVVGAAADRAGRSRPETYRAEFKRDLGDTWVSTIGGRDYRPEDLVSEVLHFVRERAETVAGEGFRGVELTVPASYEHSRRELMRAAGVAAGFSADDVHLVEEPVAAAAFALVDTPAAPGDLLVVYDLGGGTFDVALVEAGTGNHVVRGHRGLAECGGVHFDRLILERLLQQGGDRVHAALVVPAAGDADEVGAQLRRQLGILEFCREIKHDLSVTPEADDLLVEVTPPVRFSMSQQELADLIRPLLEETLQECDKLVADAGASWNQVARIVMVGGSTLIPAVAELLASSFGRPVVGTSDPELAIAHGAALMRHRRVVAAAGSSQSPSAPAGPSPEAAELPAELRAALASPYAGIREAAVQELVALLANPSLAKAARHALARLVDDDSRRVSTAASLALVEASGVSSPAPATTRPVPAEPAAETRRAAPSRAKSPEPSGTPPAKTTSMKKPSQRAKGRQTPRRNLRPVAAIEAESFVLAVALSPEGDEVVLSRRGGQVELWELGPPAQRRWSTVINGSDVEKRAVLFAAGGAEVIVGTDKGDLWRRQRSGGAGAGVFGDPFNIFSADRNREITGLLAVPGKPGQVVFVRWSGQVERYHVSAGSRYGRWKTNRINGYGALAVSADDKYVASGGTGDGVAIYVAADGALSSRVSQSGDVIAMATQPHTGALVTAGKSSIERWRFSPPYSPIGTVAAVRATALAFIDQDRLASGHDDGRVLVWDLNKQSDRVIDVRVGGADEVVWGLAFAQGRLAVAVGARVVVVSAE